MNFSALGNRLPEPVTHWRQLVEVEVRKPRSRSEVTAKRQREFASGRECAHRLLSESACDVQVGVNPDRSPSWPAGFVGSISHSRNWTWAAIAPSEDLRSLGIDTEPIVSRETRLYLQAEIATPGEWSIAKSNGLSPEQVFSLVFSAKESFYKCWYPLTGEYFGFDMARIESVSDSCIRVRNHSSNPNLGCQPEVLNVEYFIDEDDVFTTTWIAQ